MARHRQCHQYRCFSLSNDSLGEWSSPMQMPGHFRCKRLVKSNANGWSNGLQFPITVLPWIASPRPRIQSCPQGARRKTRQISRWSIRIPNSGPASNTELIATRPFATRWMTLPVTMPKCSIQRRKHGSLPKHSAGGCTPILATLTAKPSISKSRPTTWAAGSECESLTVLGSVEGVLSARRTRPTPSAARRSCLC